MGKVILQYLLTILLLFYTTTCEQNNKDQLYSIKRIIPAEWYFLYIVTGGTASGCDEKVYANSHGNKIELGKDYFTDSSLNFYVNIPDKGLKFTFQILDKECSYDFSFPYICQGKSYGSFNWDCNNKFYGFTSLDGKVICHFTPI
jgi:hypothetical protein